MIFYPNYDCCGRERSARQLGSAFVAEGSGLDVCVAVEESRLQEKLGHHLGSGEVSPTQPPVLFHCLTRLACV